MSTATHNFETSLARSHELERADFWREVYEKFFPGHVAVIRHSQDGWQQRAGIDASVVMPDSRQLFVDEKVRAHDFGDLLVEEYSDYERGVYGWAAKPLRADYILYVCLDGGRAYCLPVLQLQAAFRRNYEAWTSGEPVTAKNRDPRTGREWTSICWRVKVPELFGAIGQCLRANFKPVGE